MTMTLVWTGVALWLALKSVVAVRLLDGQSPSDSADRPCHGGPQPVLSGGGRIARRSIRRKRLSRGVRVPASNFFNRYERRRQG